MKLSDYGRKPLICPECGYEMDVRIGTESALWHTVYADADCTCGYETYADESSDADQAIRKLRWIVKKAGDAS